MSERLQPPIKCMLVTVRYGMPRSTKLTCPRMRISAYQMNHCGSDGVGSMFTASDFTHYNYCTPLATTLPVYSSPAGVALEKLGHPNARSDAPSQSPKPPLTTNFFRVRFWPPPLFPSSRSSSSPRPRQTGRAADLWCPRSQVRPREH